MNWNPAEGFIEFDALWTTAIALLLLMTGYALRKKMAFLDKYCIPAPVIGGLLMSFMLLILHHSGGSAIKFTTSLQTPLMIAFFTTVGIGGSLSSLKRGGSALIVYLFCCWGLAIFQNAFGSGLPIFWESTPCSASWQVPFPLKEGMGPLPLSVPLRRDWALPVPKRSP
jgi:Na+/glutamate symporter